MSRRSKNRKHKKRPKWNITQQILEKKVTRKEAAELKQDLVTYQVDVLKRPPEKALKTAERAIAAMNQAAEEFKRERCKASK